MTSCFSHYAFSTTVEDLLPMELYQNNFFSLKLFLLEYLITATEMKLIQGLWQKLN